MTKSRPAVGVRTNRFSPQYDAISWHLGSKWMVNVEVLDEGRGFWNRRHTLRCNDEISMQYLNPFAESVFLIHPQVLYRMGGDTIQFLYRIIHCPTQLWVWL